MATVSSTSNFWIQKNALGITLNAMGNPDYVQVSVVSGAVILAFMEGIIDFDAAHNYRRWAIEAYPTVFSSSAAQNVYARLDLSEPERGLSKAMIVYSSRFLDVYGRASEEDEPSAFRYIYLGQIGSSEEVPGKTNAREWKEMLFNEGRLTTDQQQKEESSDELKKMFIIDEFTHFIKPQLSFAFAKIRKLFVGVGEKLITDVKRSTDSDASVPISDENVTTSAYVKSNFLSKQQNDRARGEITFDKTSRWGYFQEGVSGAAIQEKEGQWHAEVDFLHVRKKLTAKEVTIEETSSVGGAQLLSAASAHVEMVEELADAYRCYFLRQDGSGRSITNKWKVGDQALANTFNLQQQADTTIGNHYLWRLVTRVGTGGGSAAYGNMTDYHWLDLSKTVMDAGSDVPKAGDCLVQLGNQNNEEGRNSAIYIVGAGSSSPYVRLFKGIVTFVLPEPEVQLKPGDNHFSGRVNISGGTGAANLEDLPEFISNAVKIGGENLLRNTGFDGEYNSVELDMNVPLEDGSELYSPKMEYWEGNGISIENPISKSGRACQLGIISQTVNLIPGERYVLSLRGGRHVNIQVDGRELLAQRLPELNHIHHIGTFKATKEQTVIRLESIRTAVWEVKLERGTIVTDWCPHILDTDAAADRFRADAYLRSALHDGSTEILGGLILSSLINLGSYKDGKMQKVSAGASGIYNNDDDVAFWGGGDLSMAMNTVAKYRNNPLYVPTEEELKTMAKAVITHGGRSILQDVILRGYVYAEGGKFRGTVEATDGVFNGSLSIKSNPIPEDRVIHLNFDSGFNFAGCSYQQSGAAGAYYVQELILPTDTKYDGVKCVIQNTAFSREEFVQDGKTFVSRVFWVKTADSSAFLCCSNYSYVGKKRIEVYGMSGIQLHAVKIDKKIRWVVDNDAELFESSWVPSVKSSFRGIQPIGLIVAGNYTKYSSSYVWNVDKGDDNHLFGERTGVGAVSFSWEHPLCVDYLPVITCTGHGYGFCSEKTADGFVIKTADDNSLNDLDFKMVVLAL